MSLPPLGSDGMGRDSNYEVTVVRAVRSAEEPYFTTRRANAQNRALTYEARGLLWYLLSKPDDWRIMICDLEQQCGRDKVYRLLKELSDAGHLVRSEQPRQERGRFGRYVYTVYETPLPDSPLPALPDAAEPLPVNPPLQIKEIPQKREKRDSASPRPRNALLDALALLCFGSLDVFKLKGVPAQLQSAASDLRALDAQIDAAAVAAFGNWWATEHWRGKRGERPKPYEVGGEYTRWRNSRPTSGEPQPVFDEEEGRVKWQY